MKVTAAIAEEVWAGARPNVEIDEETGKRKRVGRSLRKGQYNRRVIAEATVDGVEYGLHATKGWRRRRVSR